MPTPSRAFDQPPTRAVTDAERAALERLLSVPPLADELGERFRAAGHELYLVGGPVRDAIMGRVPPDLDFATDARPDEIAAVVAGWAEATWDTGIAFGTLGLQKAGERIEITTYRSEVYRSDSRNPQVSFGDTIEGDLVRRDFTVNAMAVSVPGHRFVDPGGGLADLARKVLRTPGRPEDSFGDDPLRMMRAARFAAQLGFEVTDDAVAAIRGMAGRLDIVTPERVQGELTRLLLAPEPGRGLELLVDTGLADQVLPELPRLRMETDPLHRHKDVYAHTLAVLDRAIAMEPAGPDLTLRMAALLHDIGKPKTRRYEPGGGVSFHHHEVVGRDLTRARLRTLRYPNAFVDDVCRLVELHLRFYGYGRGEWTDSAVRRYVTDAGPLLDRLHVLVRSDCTTRNPRRAAAQERAYRDLEDRITRLAEQEELSRIRPDLDGNEIMATLGIGPGPVVGRAYRHLLDRRMEEGPLGRERAVEELRRWAAEQGLA